MVKVLEAVHLLFNYEMFVVVLAVDTRWLAQSLPPSPAPDRQTLQPVVAALTPPAPAPPTPDPPALNPLAPAGAADPALADMLGWLARYPRYANAPAHRYAKWAMEVARFSRRPPNRWAAWA